MAIPMWMLVGSSQATTNTIGKQKMKTAEEHTMMFFAGIALCGAVISRTNKTINIKDRGGNKDRFPTRTNAQCEVGYGHHEPTQASFPNNVHCSLPCLFKISGGAKVQEM